MTLPKGWIASPNPAGEVNAPPYSGDQTAGWMNPLNPRGFGIQPTTDTNPAGTGGSIAVMVMTAEAVEKMFGPMPS